MMKKDSADSSIERIVRDDLARIADEAPLLGEPDVITFTARRSDHGKRRGLLMASAAAAVVLAASVFTVQQVVDSRERTPPSQALPVGAGAVSELNGRYAWKANTVADLATRTVVLGEVTNSRLGEPVGPKDDQLQYDYLTIRVEQQTGEEPVPDEFLLWGQFVDSRGVRVVAPGHPWLEVGDRVLVGLVHETEGNVPKLYAAAGPWSLYLIKDGKVVLPARVAQDAYREPVPEVARDLEGLSEAAALDLLER